MRIGRVREYGGKTKVWLKGVEGTKWYTRFDDSDDELKYVFDGKSWVKGVGGDLNVKPDLKDNCVVFPVVPGSTAGTKVCAVAKNLSGKKMSEFLKDRDGKSIVCKRIYDDATIPGCDPEQTLPPNSVAYDLTFSVASDMYEVWTGSSDWIGYHYAGINWSNPAASTPTISKFLKALEESPQWNGSNCSVGFKVKTVATDGLSGVMEWGANTSRSCNSANVDKYTETTTFKVETVGDRQVLRTFYPNLYRSLNPGDISGAGEMIFTVVEKEVSVNGTPTKINGIFSGEFSAAARSNTIPFTGNINASTQVTNKTLFDAAMKAMGVGDYPYPK